MLNRRSNNTGDLSERMLAPWPVDCTYRAPNATEAARYHANAAAASPRSKLESAPERTLQNRGKTKSGTQHAGCMHPALHDTGNVHTREARRRDPHRLSRTEVNDFIQWR